MLTYYDLRKGVQFVLDSQPHEVLEFKHMKQARGAAVVQTKIKNLMTGKIVDRNFHQKDKFEEADLGKKEMKFIYSHRDKFYFTDVKNPSQRLELDGDKIGQASKFLKRDQLVIGIIFKEQVINIFLPIKVNLKVTEAALGIKGDRSQSGTKTVTLETGLKINVPLFMKLGDVIEVNTETGEYVRRVE